MKKIFNWMRKQPLKAFKVYDGSIGVEPSEVNRLIDEAEAKWEADYCIWKPYKQYKYIILPPHEKHHGMWREELKREPYCSRCGKPIKISEVE